MNTTATSTAAGTSNLQLEYLSSHSVASQPASWWQSVLGVVGFENPPILDRPRIPVTASMTRSLNGNDLCEVWRVLGPGLSSGDTAQTRVQYRYSEDLLFGCLTIAEEAIDARSEAGALLRATEIAYQEIFDVLNETQHRHLIRIWNYLPDINAQAGDDERYRHFNSARQMAFRKSGRATMGTVPAACALGSPTGSPISIYFLAARRPPKMIENPRQTSAYLYPPKFGKHSPIFSRACVWGESGAGNLFISGTASIVGHETIHPGDVVAQTRETMINIEATLSQLLTSADDIVYLQADVCREDLLVEIEAIG
jgi:chorismate lyase/3-hydroxybenzoate synthase